MPEITPSYCSNYRLTPLPHHTSCVEISVGTVSELRWQLMGVVGVKAQRKCLPIMHYSRHDQTCWASLYDFFLSLCVDFSSFSIFFLYFQPSAFPPIRILVLYSVRALGLNGRHWAGHATTINSVCSTGTYEATFSIQKVESGLCMTLIYLFCFAHVSTFNLELQV